MKPTILILLAALAVSGCEQSYKPRREVIEVIGKPDSNGIVKYEYYTPPNWQYFYDTIGKYHIGQRIPFDNIK